MLCVVCKGLLSVIGVGGKGEGRLDLWYQVPYLFAVVGSSRAEHRGRAAGVSLRGCFCAREQAWLSCSAG